MFRLRRSVRQLANGERVKKVYFRDGDMWQGFANDFNDLVTRLDMEETKSNENHQQAEPPKTELPKTELSKTENDETPDVNVPASDADLNLVPLGVTSTTSLPPSSDVAAV